jgi:hypothetical protein
MRGTEVEWGTSVSEIYDNDREVEGGKIINGASILVRCKF